MEGYVNYNGPQYTINKENKKTNKLGRRESVPENYQRGFGLRI